MIKKLEFFTDIKAAPTAIWRALWEDQYYRDWAGIFYEGSHIVVNKWDENHKVHFLGPDNNGIYSLIEKHIPNQSIKFKHIGNVMKGKEQSVDNDSKKWSGANEVYTLIPQLDGQRLKVSIDVMNEHLDFMTKTFPKALKTIKENSISLKYG